MIYLLLLKKPKSLTSRMYVYSCDSDFHSIIRNLKYDLNILQKWFKINSMKANP